MTEIEALRMVAQEAANLLAWEPDAGMRERGRTPRGRTVNALYYALKAIPNAAAQEGREEVAVKALLEFQEQLRHVGVVQTPRDGWDWARSRTPETFRHWVRALTPAAQGGERERTAIDLLGESWDTIKDYAPMDVMARVRAFLHPPAQRAEGEGAR